jgi:hypothetical protein
MSFLWSLLQGCAVGLPSSSGCSHPTVRVELLWNGVTDRDSVYAQPIVYAIVLETLLPGGLPAGAAKVLLLLVVALLVTYRWIAPWLGRLLHRERSQLGLLDDSSASKSS